MDKKINWVKVLFGGVLSLYGIFLFLAFLQLLGTVSWGEFLPMLQNPDIKFSILFSLTTSLIAIIGSILVGIPSAYVLSRYYFPGIGLVETILYIPVFLPPLVSGLALLLLFSEGGMVGSKLDIEFVFTPQGVVLAQFFVATPFAIRAFQAAFNSVNIRLEEAAETLGDTPGMVFKRITLPLAWKGLFGGIMLAWSRALGEFGATIMLAGAIRGKTETLPISVYLNMSLGELDSAVIVAAIMLLLSVSFLFILRLLFTPAYKQFS